MPSLVENCTVAPPAIPTLRVTVIVASPALWATTKAGPVNSMRPPASSSAIVSVAWAGGTMLIPGGSGMLGVCGLPRVRRTVREPTAAVLLMMGTVNVLDVVPAPKLSVPATAW